MVSQAHWYVLGFALNAQTIVGTWCVIALTLVLFGIASIGLSVEKPGFMQNVLEMVFEFVHGFVSERLDRKEEQQKLYFLLLALFLFILIANLFNLIPQVKSPTEDPNVTFGLAIVIFVLIHFYGAQYRGFFRHLNMSLFQPVSFLAPINLLELLANPLTLALRLFGNIFAGDVILGLGNSMIPVAYVGASAAIGLVGSIIIIVGSLAFNTFVDLIQSYVFVMLSLSYVAASMSATSSH